MVSDEYAINYSNSDTYEDSVPPTKQTDGSIDAKDAEEEINDNKKSVTSTNEED